MPRIILALALVLALAFPASANHCTSYSSTTPVAEAGGHYVSWDFCVPIDCHLSMWVYEESNGIAGLQRGDEVVDDTCHQSIRPDTIVF